jgi:hypothetical protein
MDKVKEVQTLAGEYFTNDEITIALELDPSVQIEKWFIDAVNTGALTTKSIVNKGVMKLAKQGSGPAQTLALKMERQTIINKIWNE